MTTFLTSLPWQHQLLVLEALVSMSFALYYVHTHHVVGVKESAAWALWDAAALALFVWGGVTMGIPHLVYGSMMAWALYRNVERVVRAVPAEAFKGTLGPAITLVTMSISFFQISMLQMG